MPRYDRFSFACDTEEREAKKALAERLQRTQSDAVRWVVKEAARELATSGAVKALPPKADTANAQAN